MKNISAIIITKNEEKNIERCLNSIKGLVDEIILVDSGSTDKTLEIARKFTNNIFFRAWTDDFAAQKNYALSKAEGKWILSIDADEIVTPELALEVKKFIASDEEKKYDGMRVPRKNIILGKWLRHGGCWPDYQLRFFHRESCFQRPVHEIVILNGPAGYFKHPVIHDHYHTTIREHLMRHQKYSDIEIKALLEEGSHPSLWAVFFYPPAKFLLTYFIKLGFLDGWGGLLWSEMNAYYSFLKRYKFWKHRR